MEKIPPQKQKSGLITAILLLILLLFTLLNYLILANTHYLYKGDSADHLIKSILCFQGIQQLNIPQFCWGDYFYPPFMYQVSALFYFLFPPSMISVGMTHIPFWAVLIFSIYGIGSLLFSPLIGLLAVFYFLTAPYTILWSYQYMLDIPAAAMLALAFYLLLKSQNFQNRLYAALFGIVLGLGMLTKWWIGYLLLGPLLYYLLSLYLNAVKGFFLRISGFLVSGGLFYAFIKIAFYFEKTVGPPQQNGFWPFLLLTLAEGMILGLSLRGIFYLARIMKKANSENLPALINFTDSLVLCFLTCGWLYLNPHFALLNGMLFETGAVGSIWPWPHLPYYPYHLVFNVLRVGYAPFILIGLALFLVKGWKNPAHRMLLFTLITSFVLLIVMPNKQERYLLPWLALAAPVAVFWLDYLGKFKIIPGAYLILLGLLYSFCAWHPVLALYKDNSVLAFFTRGNPPLTEMKETIVIEPEKLKEFIKPLPRRNETLLFFIRTNMPFGDNIVRTPMYLEGLTSLDFSERKKLGDYKYIIYSITPDETQKNIRQKLKIERPYLPDWDQYDFDTLSRCPVTECGFDLVLAKLQKKREPQAPPKNAP